MEPIICARFAQLVDLVAQEGGVRYLVCKDRKISVEESWTDDNGQVFRPPDRGMVPFTTVEAARVLECAATDTGALYQNLVEQLQAVSMLPGDPYYHLCATFVFFSYLSESAPYFPVIWFFGPPERGKSRLVKVLTRLSWRGLYSETLNEAYLFRFAELFRGTLGLDVFELSNRAQKKGSYDLLLGRFEEGLKVPRVIAPDKGDFRDTRYYRVAGPTILATNKEISPRDPLRSRCIKIAMPEARGVYRNYPESDLAVLRARLLAFRAAYLNRPLPSAPKPVPGRLGDLLQPLLSVAMLLPPEATENLRALIGDLETERREAEGETLAGRIAAALYSLQGNVTGGRLPVALVTEKLNEGLRERYRLSPNRVGRELQALGIKRVKSVGAMQIVWEEKVIDSLFVRYGVTDRDGPELSPPRPQSPQTYDLTTEKPGEREIPLSPISPAFGEIREFGEIVPPGFFPWDAIPDE
jgi:hypothetical protein